MRLRVVAVGAAALLIAAASASVAVTADQTAQKDITAKDFDPRNFDRSTTIDNEWLPMKPGKQLVSTGSSIDGDRRVHHREVLTVTDMTKVISGVRARIIWFRDYTDGNLIESELTFYAQDNDGNVWHMGQYRETYDEVGEFVGSRVFFAGIAGAKPGFWMKAEPRLGTPAYSQGFAPPPIYWADVAKVYKVGQATCVPVGCFKDVLVTDEWDTFEPGAHQLKYYARGVGNIRVGWRGNDPEKETLVLSKVLHLGPKAMAKVRAKVLEHEARAYTYGRTPPAKRSARKAP